MSALTSLCVCVCRHCQLSGARFDGPLCASDPGFRNGVDVLYRPIADTLPALDSGADSDGPVVWRIAVGTRSYFDSVDRLRCDRLAGTPTLVACDLVGCGEEDAIMRSIIDGAIAHGAYQSACMPRLPVSPDAMRCSIAVVSGAAACGRWSHRPSRNRWRLRRALHPT